MNPFVKEKLAVEREYREIERPSRGAQIYDAVYDTISSFVSVISEIPAIRDAFLIGDVSLNESLAKVSTLYSEIHSTGVSDLEIFSDLLARIAPDSHIETAFIIAGDRKARYEDVVPYRVDGIIHRSSVFQNKRWEANADRLAQEKLDSELESKSPIQVNTNRNILDVIYESCANFFRIILTVPAVRDAYLHENCLFNDLISDLVKTISEQKHNRKYSDIDTYMALIENTVPGYHMDIVLAVTEPDKRVVNVRADDIAELEESFNLIK